MIKQELQKIDRKLALVEARLAKLKAEMAKPTTPGSYVTGGSNRHPSLDRRLDRENEKAIDNAKLLLHLERQLRDGQILRANVAAGEVHPNGQPCKEAPSRQRAREQDALYAAYLQARIKPGDLAEFYLRNDGTKVLVKRVNLKTVTLEMGDKWEVTAIRPLNPDGSIMSKEEFLADLRRFREEGS